MDQWWHLLNLHCLTGIHCLPEAPADGPHEDPFQGGRVPDCWESQLYVICDVSASSIQSKKI